MENFLRTLICTLNTIEVHGKENLDKLLATIMAAEKELEELTMTLEKKGEDADE